VRERKHKHSVRDQTAQSLRLCKAEGLQSCTLVNHVYRALSTQATPELPGGPVMAALS
jgi:hypothetical protein